MKLSTEAKKLYDEIKSSYDIQDEAGLLLLQTSMESFDLMRKAQSAIDKDGLLIKDRFEQLKSHPATVTLRDAKSSMLMALKSLNLDLEPLRDGRGRPGSK